MMAWYFDKHEATLRLRDYAIATLLLLLPVVMILRQPDLGTALLIASSGFYVLFLTGLVMAHHRGAGNSRGGKLASAMVDDARLSAPARHDPA